MAVICLKQAISVYVSLILTTIIIKDLAQNCKDFVLRFQRYFGFHDYNGPMDPVEIPFYFIFEG